MSSSPSAALVHKSLPNYKSEKWLQKYGWERGKGLGKEEQGRLDFVKVSKKDNSKGLGTPSYEVKHFQFWDDIYTKAAQSISIGESNDQGEVELKKEKKVETGKSVYSGLFVTGGTMDDERHKRKTIGSETDLVEACGTHDLRKNKQDGKKARLEQHDSAMKAHIEEHRRKKVDEAYDKITDAVQVQTVKGVEKAEKKKAKQEKEKRIKSNRKAEERKKKRKREALQEVSSSEEEPKTKRHKSKAE